MQIFDALMRVVHLQLMLFQNAKKIHKIVAHAIKTLSK